MHPVASILNGSHMWGAGQNDEEDVDILDIYAMPSSSAMWGTEPIDTPYKVGNLHCEPIEIKVLAERLIGGDSKYFVSVLSRSFRMTSHQHQVLRSILTQYLTLGFADSLVQFVESIQDDKIRAMRYIDFGIGYFKDKKSVLTSRESVSDDELAAGIEELKTAIDDADKQVAKVGEDGQEFKVYDHAALTAALQSWVISSRREFVKYEEMLAELSRR